MQPEQKLELSRRSMGSWLQPGICQQILKVMHRRPTDESTLGQGPECVLVAQSYRPLSRHMAFMGKYILLYRSRAQLGHVTCIFQEDCSCLAPSAMVSAASALAVSRASAGQPALVTNVQRSLHSCIEPLHSTQEGRECLSRVQRNCFWQSGCCHQVNAYVNSLQYLQALRTLHLLYFSVLLQAVH